MSVVAHIETAEPTEASAKKKRVMKPKPNPATVTTRAYRTELDPNATQERYFFQAVGATRWVYNWNLAERMRRWERYTKLRGNLVRWREEYSEQLAPRLDRLTAEESRRYTEARLSFFDWCKELTILKMDPERAWLGDMDRTALNATLQNLDRAFANFYRRAKKHGAGDHSECGGGPVCSLGYPRFKRRQENGVGFKFLSSVRVEEVHAPATVEEDGTIAPGPYYTRICLPKIGWVRLKESEHLPLGTVKIASGAVTRRAGRWFVSIAVVEPRVSPKPALGPVLGIHMGIRQAVTCSDGTVYEMPRPTEEQIRRKEILGRRMARCKEGSVAWKKAAKQLADLEFQIACRREYAQQWVTTQIVRKRSAALHVEAWDIAGMKRDRRFAKGFQEVGAAEMIRQLRYKADWAGIPVHTHMRTFPASQMCNQCGALNEKMADGRRVFRCEPRMISGRMVGCGYIADREVNATNNIARPPEKCDIC